MLFSAKSGHQVSTEIGAIQANLSCWPICLRVKSSEKAVERGLRSLFMIFRIKAEDDPNVPCGERTAGTLVSMSSEKDMVRPDGTFNEF